MKPSSHLEAGLSLEQASFLSCLATVLELPPARMPKLSGDEDPAAGWTVPRWLGGLGLGLAQVADPGAFAWAGPWLARIRPPNGTGEPRFVVMYGVPSGAVWDPARDREDGHGPTSEAMTDRPAVPGLERDWIDRGYLIAAGDIALARPELTAPPPGTGTVEQIWVSAAAGEPARAVGTVRGLAGRGLEGDRHVAGTGTFPSGLPGSALTLVEAEVCDSFEPQLGPDQHRRNIVTRGINLNQLVGHEFTIGSLRCRGMRLCEPCTVVQGYADRPVLRALVHRGGLRADILVDGAITIADEVRALVPVPPRLPPE